MKEYLNFGIGIDNEGDAFESVADTSAYFPPNHEYMMAFIDKSNKDNIGDILTRIKHSYKDPSIDKNILISQIKNIHPYFNICDNAEACFNKTLANVVFTDNTLKDVQKTFESSMYRKRDIETDINYWLMSDIEPFGNILECYDDLRQRIALIFDDSKEKLSKLPIASRCALYNTISEHDDSILEIPVRYEYSPSLSSTLSTLIDFDDDANIIYQDILSITPEGNDISDRIFNILNRSSDGDDNQLCYIVNSFSALMQLETYLMLRDNIRINRCKNCGRMYVIATEGQEYCKYVNANGNSCYSDSKRREFEQQISKFYRRAYKTMFDRVANGNETQANFDLWKKDMTDRKKNILNGSISYTLDDGNPFKYFV